MMGVPPFEQSAFLDATHGFFGREGGSSQGEFASLNMSVAVGDDPETVDHNRSFAASALGYKRHHLRLLKQVHSNRVRVLTEIPDEATFEADAMVTNVHGLMLGILTADCTPILLSDATAGVVGAVHAGWRGAVDGIVANTIASMVLLGAKPSRIVAAIGPTITQPNYEVGEQFRGDFLSLHPTGGQFFSSYNGDKPHFDLPAFVADQLARADVETVDRVGGCTYGDPQRYFSHRYTTHNGGRTGRQMAVIVRR